jgi:hypothetical protein
MLFFAFFAISSRALRLNALVCKLHGKSEDKGHGKDRHQS